MPEFRRYFGSGGRYFFTVVTAGRVPVFGCDRARTLLGNVMREVCKQRVFETVAIVLLPDHLHTVWTLPNGDADYPNRWKTIKARFRSEWLRSGGAEEQVGGGYRRQRRRGVWQPRFMEHTIRGEQDLLNHADYIHYNPVKRGQARCPKDWPWSSFRRYARSGDYPEDWGSAELPPPDFDDVDPDLLA